MKRTGRLFAKLAGIGTLLTLLISPTQLGFTTKCGLNLCLADLLLLPVAACWFVAVLLQKRLAVITKLEKAANTPRRDPSIWRLWPQLVLVALTLCSVLVAAKRGAALKDALQIALYLVVATNLFYDFLRTGFMAEGATAQATDASGRQRLTLLLAALLLPLTANLVIAATQYFSTSCADLDVRGIFGNRNVLGGFLALVVPLLFVLPWFKRRRRWLWLPVALFTVGAFAFNLSGPAYCALALVLLLLAWRRAPLCGVALLVIILAWQALVMPRLPRENDLVHFRSAALYNANGAPERRYPEWQAAMSLLLTHPLRGIGGGNYQHQIGRYYDVVPNPTGPSEPDIQNLYLVFAVNLGLPGLLMLLMSLGNAGLAAATAAASSRESDLRALAAGVAGGLAAFVITALWHPLLVRGIGLPLGAMMALAYAMRDLASEKSTPPKF